MSDQQPGDVNPDVDPGVAHAVAQRLWLLVPSFLLGPATWNMVAETLTGFGQDSVVPCPVRTTPRDTDHITPWLDGVLASVPPTNELPIVVVGHSASGPRLPLVVDRLTASGHTVTAMILVNSRIPEDGGIPTERDSPFMNTLDSLERPDGYLPPWHRWWGQMIEDMLPDDAARERVLSEAKPVPRATFDQPIPAPKLAGEVSLGFLALGRMYEPSYLQARDEGWNVLSLDGEHLHMVVDPMTVAGALLSLVGQGADGR